MSALQWWVLVALLLRALCCVPVPAPPALAAQLFAVLSGPSCSYLPMLADPTAQALSIALAALAGRLSPELRVLCAVGDPRKCALLAA